MSGWMIGQPPSERQRELEDNVINLRSCVGEDVHDEVFYAFISVHDYIVIKPST